MKNLGEMRENGKDNSIGNQETEGAGQRGQEGKQLETRLVLAKLPRALSGSLSPEDFLLGSTSY